METQPEATPTAWVLSVLAAVLIKLSASVDDVAWLLPFVAGPRRQTNLWRAAQYVLTMVLVAGIASCIAIGGGAAIGAATSVDSPWPSERVLGLISGCALAIYAVYLFKGWLEERQEELNDMARQRAADGLRSIVATARAAEEFFRSSGAQQRHQAASSATVTEGTRAAAHPSAADGGDDESGVWVWVESIGTALGLTPQKSLQRATDDDDAAQDSTCYSHATLSPSASPLPRSTGRNQSACSNFDCTPLQTNTHTLAHTETQLVCAGRLEEADGITTPGAPLTSCAAVHDRACGRDPHTSTSRESAAGSEACVAVERCRALMRLQAALGVEAYELRKRALLEELIGASPGWTSLEVGAEALETLHAIGFLGSSELGLWVDRLLMSAEVIEARTATLTARSLHEPMALETDMRSARDSHADDHSPPSTGSLNARRLFVVSVLGSLDDLAVFISLLLGGTFTWAQLLIGVLLGATIVVCFCLFVSVFRPITRLIQMVPLFVIVGAFAVYTFIEVAIFDTAVGLELNSSTTFEPSTSAGSRRLEVIGANSSVPPMGPTDALLVPAIAPATLNDGSGVLRLYLEALALSVSSSTDNFAVGASLGIAGLVLQHRFNLAIAVANGSGALVAAGGGREVGRVAAGAGAWVAATVFAYLAWQEGSSLWRGETASPLLRLAERGVAARLAVPMTLNNLAGGVAGGVLGIGPLLAGGSALVASFLMMALGYCLGTCAHTALSGSRLDVRLLSCTIFAGLALGQVLDKLTVLMQQLLARIGLFPFTDHATIVVVGLVLLAGVGMGLSCTMTRSKSFVSVSAETTDRLMQGARAAVKGATTSELSAPLSVERCRALMRLQAALGVEAYELRKRALLEELIGASPGWTSLEVGAEALETLHAIGFLGSSELGLWVDRLLCTDWQASWAQKAALQTLTTPQPASSAPPSTPRSVKRLVSPMKILWSPHNRSAVQAGGSGELV